jgi:formyltetrahydrofolate synthetase
MQLTMPGLSSHPATESIDTDDHDQITGLS